MDVSGPSLLIESTDSIYDKRVTRICMGDRYSEETNHIASLQKSVNQILAEVSNLNLHEVASKTSILSCKLSQCLGHFISTSQIIEFVTTRI